MRAWQAPEIFNNSQQCLVCERYVSRMPSPNDDLEPLPAARGLRFHSFRARAAAHTERARPRPVRHVQNLGLAATAIAPPPAGLVHNHAAPGGRYQGVVLGGLAPAPLYEHPSMITAPDARALTSRWRPALFSPPAGSPGSPSDTPAPPGPAPPAPAPIETLVRFWNGDIEYTEDVLEELKSL